MPRSLRQQDQDSAAELAELHERVRRLEKINVALIDRVERSSDLHGSAFSMFETAISLESMVRERTTALEEVLAHLASANADLATAHRDADAARARLRDAIESLSDGFALFDGDDRLVMCNHAYLGLWPQVGELAVSPPRFADVAEAVARSGRAVGARVAPERWVADRVARHEVADGIHIQALDDGRWVQINEIRTSEGGTVGIYTDITEVKAEDARERARELADRNLALHATFDTLSEGVCLYDAQRRLLAHNASLEHLLGLTHEHRATITRHSGLVALCRRLGLEQVEIVAWRDDADNRIEQQCEIGGRLFVIRSTPIVPGGMAFSFDDVTERQRHQETLERRVAERTRELVSEVAERRMVEIELVAAKTAAEQANRSKTSFIAAASHDLLQPLNAARLFVAALGDRRLALPTRALVRQTGVALDSVEELLEAVFEISRLDAGALQPEYTDIPLDRMLAALRIEFAPLARQAGLMLDIADTGLWMKSDLRMFRRILQNFVSNAIRYTRVGSVTVQVTDEGGMLRVVVRDTGQGIDPADLETIFEEFRRLDAARQVPGKGLGLAIVRRTATMLGHEIGVQSQLGEGTSFWIRVPQAAPRPDEAPDSQYRSKIRRAKGGAILIIDNDVAILSGTRALLESWGYKVSVAQDAQAPSAQAAIDAGVDLIIADYHLEHGALGDEAIVELRQRAGRPISAMVISADRSEEVKAKIAALGAPLLNKPVKPAQLRALLRTLLTDPESAG